MFLPNQKVVCVDGKFPLGIEKLYAELPKEAATYTIRDIVPGVGLTGEEGETAVYLCEITGPLNAHGIERGFRGRSIRAAPDRRRRSRGRATGRNAGTRAGSLAAHAYCTA
jgi:hypothetical protein